MNSIVITEEEALDKIRSLTYVGSYYDSDKLDIVYPNYLDSSVEIYFEKGTSVKNIVESFECTQSYMTKSIMGCVGDNRIEFSLLEKGTSIDCTTYSRDRSIYLFTGTDKEGYQVSNVYIDLQLDSLFNSTNPVITWEEMLYKVDDLTLIGEFNSYANVGLPDKPEGNLKDLFGYGATINNILDSFHATNYYIAEAKDEYIGDIRANHFLLEAGYSEECAIYSKQPLIYVLTGNHKGQRVSEVYIDLNVDYLEEEEFLNNN